MKVLIADDEPHIRNGLRKRIHWEELGIEEVATAQDGEEALQICKDLRPEMIITDIRMPGIDGLELAERAAVSYGAKKILIMSGYSEFEYAQTAIKIGVVDYLLKPVNLEEITNTIRNSVREIKEEREKEKLSFQKRVHSLLQGLVNQEEKPDSLLEEAKGLGEIICGVIRVDSLYGKPAYKITEEMFEEAVRGVGNMTCGTNEEMPLLFYREETHIVFLLKIPDSKVRNTYHSICSTFLYCLNKNNAVSCSMGVSSIGYFRQIQELYAQAENALCHRLYQGESSCIFCEMISAEKQRKAAFFQDMKAFKEQAGYFHIEEACEQIRLGFQILYQEHCTDQKKPQELCISVKNALTETMHEKGIDVLGLLDQNREMFQIPLEFNTLQSYEQWCIDYCHLILKGLNDLAKGRHSAAVAKAVDYISQHYMEDISLGYLAELACKSTNYFSCIFKKEMGMNFNEYLNEVRIRRAKELLRTTDSMIYEVSESVGYHDYKYFTKVFKKVCGCSPSEFKEQ